MTVIINLYANRKVYVVPSLFVSFFLFFCYFALASPVTPCTRKLGCQMHYLKVLEE